VYLYPSKTPDAQIEKLESMVRQHDKWEAQVLVPVNEKSPVCRAILNVRLQKLLNSDGEPVKGTKFRIGDKIVCTQNGWYQVSGEISQQIDEADVNDRSEVRIANGELAEVVNLHPRGFVAKLESPRRHVIVSVGKESGKDAATDGEDSQAESPSEETSKESSPGGLKWELGYALSCHKAQGSEFPFVYIMVDEYPGARSICDASWVMTAISRAKQECYLIGNPETAQRWCRSWKIGDRKTFLKERLIAASVEKELEAI
jgi:ATP-dependent exoDNAse (exonuclease V) alpha subunit